MTDALVQFLRDRLDEDVVEAGKLDDGDDWEMEPWQVRRDETGAWDSYAYLRIAKARVLAEVDAKRRILDEHPPGLGWDGNNLDGPVCRTCAEAGNDGGLQGDPYPCTTLRLLALPYSSHPDYRPEWRL